MELLVVHKPFHHEPLNYSNELETILLELEKTVPLHTLIAECNSTRIALALEQIGTSLTVVHDRYQSTC